MGKPDDVMYREEIRFVAEFLDQRELVLHEPRHLVRHAFGPALPRAFPGQDAQMARRSASLGHELAGIFVTQFVERKLDALEYRERLVQELPRIDSSEFVERPEHALGIRMQRKAQSPDGLAEPDCRQRVLQHSPLAAVHVHVAARDQGQTELSCGLAAFIERLPVAAVGQKLHREPQAAGETFRKPGPVRAVAGCLGQPEHQALRILQVTGQIFPADPVLSLGGRPARESDQPAKLAVGPAVRRENDQLQMLFGRELAADDELERQVPHCRMGTHDAGDRTLVGQGEPRIAKPGGLLDEFRRMRRSAQEREVAQAMQLRVWRRGHDRKRLAGCRQPKRPCRNHSCVTRSR